MPHVIQHIDQIARQKQRDVLYLEFHPEAREERSRYRFDGDSVRREIIGWMDAHGIGWSECGPIANTLVLEGYRGQIYIDVPYDESREDYRQVRDFLEYPDGTIRYPGVRFWVLALERAMENAEHDAPGFWDEWADKF